jgi:hypothetical protein
MVKRRDSAADLSQPDQGDAAENRRNRGQAQCGLLDRDPGDMSYRCHSVRRLCWELIESIPKTQRVLSKLTFPSTASGPASLHLNGPTSVRIAPFRTGERRTVQLPLKIGSNAGLGRYTVKVELEIGGRTAVRTVTVLVTR